MSRSLALLGIGLLFGAGIGFVAALGTNASLEGHDHSDPAQHGAGTGHAAHDAAGGHMNHDLLEVPADQAPRLQLRITPDSVSGYNLHLMVENFRFAPEHTGQAHVAGEGHAHLYVDGVKVARLYGPWAHLTLPDGGAEVRVTLNTNDHRDYAVDGTAVARTVLVGK